MSDEQSYCCEENPDEPMLGTAAPVDLWLLLEYRLAWQAKALADNALSDAVRRWLADGMAALEAQGLKVRPQLIRQPEEERPELRLLIHRDGRLRQFQSGTGGYADLIRAPIEALAADPALGSPIETPRYFVCTNGRRDMCCARFGLPAYAKLRELAGDRAWQITHLGGHRFAPNVLVLPQGALYGRLAPAQLEGFVAEVESGGLPSRHLRGRPCYPQLAQAAEGLAGRPDLKLLRLDGDEHQGTATFASPKGTLSIQVQRSARPLHIRASCNDRESKAIHPFVAVQGDGPPASGPR